MRRTTTTRLALVILGLTVISILPAQSDKKKAHLDQMLQRMIKASEKAAREHGRPDAIDAGEMEFFKRTVVASDKRGTPMVRVRLELDAATRQTIEQKGIKTYGRMAGYASALIPIARLEEIAALPGVVRMQAMRKMAKELNVSRAEVRSTNVEATYGSRGRGVIVGSIDTGVDWRNDDFRNSDGTTRIKYLWNQDDNCTGLVTPPPPLDFGCLYTEADINAALTGGPAIDAPDADGHGTHTLGISAGNGRATGSGQPANVYVGMAPEADIIVVKTFPEPGDASSCDGCFDLSGGLEFIDMKAAELGKPYAVNMSLGSQFGSHDGFDVDEITIDSLIGAGIPGKSIVKSAGNERGHAIHIGGTVAAGATNTHNFTIPSYTALPGTFNDAIAFSLYYNFPDTLNVTIADPTTAPCTSTQALSVNTGSGQQILSTTSGRMLIDDTGSPQANGARYFDMEVDDAGGSNPCRGIWQLRVRGIAVPTGGRYDAWIWFTSFGASALEALWNLPEDARNISIPGNSFDVTTVGGYYTKLNWLSTDGNTYQFNFTPPAALGALAAFSSGGPTRDGRIKPEIMAPASAIVSTLSVDAAPTVDPPLIVPDDHHWALPGTSMSSPHVTGIYAQMLALNPNLDSNELRLLATGTARQDANVPLPVPNNNWGSGKIDALGMANRAVQNIPDVTPTNGSGTFGWTSLPTATTYNVYRGDLSLNAPGYYGSCLASGLAAATFNDAAIPVEGSGFFYLVTGVWNGVEGSLGTTSDGTPRINSSPCP